MTEVFERREVVWTKEMKPTGWVNVGEYVMSNFDHAINERTANKLRGGGCWAGYPAIEFFGEVWFDADEDRYKCFIRRLGTFPGTIVAETLQEIMDTACEKYGDA